MEGKVSFMYQLVCRGEIGPVRAKLALIDGKKKYMVRGYSMDANLSKVQWIQRSPVKSESFVS